jgi:hypothetical protein
MVCEAVSTTTGEVMSMMVGDAASMSMSMAGDAMSMSMAGDVASMSMSMAGDVYARICSCRQCWASKCRGL